MVRTTFDSGTNLISWGNSGATFGDFQIQSSFEIVRTKLRETEMNVGGLWHSVEVHSRLGDLNLARVAF